MTYGCRQDPGPLCVPTNLPLRPTPRWTGATHDGPAPDDSVIHWAGHGVSSRLKNWWRKAENSGNLEWEK